MRYVKKNECEKLHRELWNWLAKTGSIEKSNWPGWTKYKTRDYNKCFACEFTFKNDMHNCTKCPLDWCKQKQIDLDWCKQKQIDDSVYNYLEDFCQCECVTTSLFFKWEKTNKTYLKKKYAKKISEMPWNPK